MTPKQSFTYLLRFGSWVLIALALPSLAQAQDQAQGERIKLEEAIRSRLPNPPAGFSWQLFKNTALLRPDGWYERTIESKAGSAVPMNVYAASPEQFSLTKQFEMGITLQVISGPKEMRNIPAKQAALLYLKPFLDAHKPADFSILEKNSRGDAEHIFVRYRDAPPGMKPVTVHKFIVANDVADSVHVFTFESPEESWQENWDRFGTPILEKVLVIPGLPSR